MILRCALLTSPLEGEVAGLRSRAAGGGWASPSTSGALTPHPPEPRTVPATSPSRGEVKARRFGRARGRRGLSLLEVIVAMAILVLAIVAIGRLVDIGTDRGNDARAYTRGTRLAQSKMAEVEAGVVSLTSETDGQFDGDDAAWSFKVTPEPTGPPNLYTVTVRVNRDVQGRPVEIVLTQIMFDPTKMGSSAQAQVSAADSGTGTGTGGTSP